jgi:hypothetical protein
MIRRSSGEQFPPGRVVPPGDAVCGSAKCVRLGEASRQSEAAA